MEQEKYSILIVDDNKDNIKVLGLALREKNFDLTVAFSGPDALKTVESVKIDLILLDIMMPGMDGFEVCSVLKSNENTRDIPVIFITALTETNNIVRGFEVGGIDYITKPFKKRELFARVDTQLEILRQKRLLAIQTEELKETIKSRDKLYAIIAHDIRSPLANIKSVLAALQGNFIDRANFNELVEMLLNTTNETFDLLENLLLWSKNKLSGIKIERTHFNVLEIIERIAGLLKPAADKKNITLLIEADPDIELYADRNMIGTVIRNLTSNAIKFTPSGGRISILVTEVENHVKISVEDNGIGISHENQKMLLYGNGQWTTYGTDKEKGSGLGFMLVLDFVRSNQGNIELKSEMGKGSTFTITFPVFTFKNFKEGTTKQEPAAAHQS
ncbi:MAG: hybrid sensor histidine kinase/response regulator [Bacteroidales bacterium]|nr:hybrid sensor histidine kinase/response regulator [Bacteroidales bacterium]